MVKIRLRRMGAKKEPYYRIVVADSRFPRDGRLLIINATSTCFFYLSITLNTCQPFMHA